MVQDLELIQEQQGNSSSHGSWDPPLHNKSVDSTNRRESKSKSHDGCLDMNMYLELEKNEQIMFDRTLIQIIGDQLPWQVKSAILSTLTIIIEKGGMALKPFLLQPQTTFVKFLQDNPRSVHSSAALALGKLSALSTRVDPLVGGLLSNLHASEGGVREAILVALKGVVKHVGKSVSGPAKTHVFDLSNELIYNDDDQIQSSSTRILGIISEV
ncbi:unnamed protein product [Lactuca saligna]|uniref:TOG domain-containing protein n=1 Tax=Lactuca saligna TaxID=75948 RepID=A0AA35V9U3_LACSI|nr:unnamed protein product [Lactuca saligna]